MARPKKTIKDLPKKWKKIITDIKKRGGSDVEVRVALKISQDLWDRLIKEIEEFSLTIKRGQDLCEAWWVKKGRINLENRQFSAVLWYMNMKNRFGWKDKTDITSGGKELPTPILSGISNVIHTNNSSIKALRPKKKN